MEILDQLGLVMTLLSTVAYVSFIRCFSTAPVQNVPANRRYVRKVR